jgi:molybdopterin-containing oxidoreductase family iron-sulfur binding subunit
MQRGPRASLAENPQDIKGGMIIDIAKCIGCHACTIGCSAGNKLSPGVVHRVVLEEEVGQYSMVRRCLVPRPGVHCQDPPCTKVWPVTTTWRNEQGAASGNCTN